MSKRIKIKINIEVDGVNIEREFQYNHENEVVNQEWNEKVEEIIDDIKELSSDLTKK